jgi:hypothetical protein
MRNILSNEIGRLSKKIKKNNTILEGVFLSFMCKHEVCHAGKYGTAYCSKNTAMFREYFLIPSLGSKLRTAISYGKLANLYHVTGKNKLVVIIAGVQNANVWVFQVFSRRKVLYRNNTYDCYYRYKHFIHILTNALKQSVIDT